MGIDRIQIRLNAFNRKRKRYGEDVCDVISQAPSTDDYGNSGVTPTTLASNVKCFVESLSERERAIGGGDVLNATHRITLESTAVTLGIRPSYKLRVPARGSVPELTFTNPIPKVGSFNPLVEVVASLRTL